MASITHIFLLLFQSTFSWIQLTKHDEMTVFDVLSVSAFSWLISSNYNLSMNFAFDDSVRYHLVSHLLWLHELVSTGYAILYYGNRWAFNEIEKSPACCGHRLYGDNVDNRSKLWISERSISLSCPFTTIFPLVLPSIAWELSYNWRSDIVARDDIKRRSCQSSKQKRNCRRRL